MTVTPDTIAVALGRATPADNSAEAAQWSMWIDDALRLIRHRLVGDGTGQVASLDDLDQSDLDYVVREAVAAQVRRPDDATSVDVAVDDGRVSRTYRTSAGRVTIRDEWWDLLSADNTVGGGAFSIRPYRGGSAHMPWCALAFGAVYCSCGADIAGYPIYETGDVW